MADVTLPKALREQPLHSEADDLVGRVPEERGDLIVREHDRARGIDDDHRIGCRIEDASNQLCGQHGGLKARTAQAPMQPAARAPPAREECVATPDSSSSPCFPAHATILARKRCRCEETYR